MKFFRVFDTLAEAEFAAGLLTSRGIRSEARDRIRKHLRKRVVPGGAMISFHPHVRAPTMSSFALGRSAPVLDWLAKEWMR